MRESNNKPKKKKQCKSELISAMNQYQQWTDSNNELKTVHGYMNELISFYNKTNS